jgi:hypothetical protein
MTTRSDAACADRPGVIDADEQFAARHSRAAHSRRATVSRRGDASAV